MPGEAVPGAASAREVGPATDSPGDGPGPLGPVEGSREELRRRPSVPRGGGPAPGGAAAARTEDRLQDRPQLGAGGLGRRTTTRRLVPGEDRGTDGIEARAERAAGRDGRPRDRVPVAVPPRREVRRPAVLPLDGAASQAGQEAEEARMPAGTGPDTARAAPSGRPAGASGDGLDGLAREERTALGPGRPGPARLPTAVVPGPDGGGDAACPAPDGRDPAASVRAERGLRRRERGGEAPGLLGGVRRADLPLRSVQPMAEVPSGEPEPDDTSLAAVQDESPRPCGRGLEANRGLAGRPSPEVTWIPDAQRGTSSIPVEWCIGRLNFAV